MLEFVLLLPLLGLVLVLTFFFGWGTVHKTQVMQANRYTPWHRINTGAWPETDQLNRDFFEDEAAPVVVDPRQAVRDTADDLVSQAASASGSSGTLADELILNRFPDGKSAEVSASFVTEQPVWKQFAGDVHYSHQREGVAWRRGEAACWETLRDQFYPGLDSLLNRVPAPGSDMAGMIRGLYLAHW